MAATKLIAMHQISVSGKRMPIPIPGEKTDEGKYISSYQCNPELVDLEFAQAKKEYLHKTWRQPKGDVIAYQIRQSFKPGEITPEEAHTIRVLCPPLSLTWLYLWNNRKPMLQTDNVA